jgi:(R,R)-butanediol dehydrogenase/meso-butanediol dehydrogenase/diacetyl reductase
MIMGVFEKPAPIDYSDLVFSEKTVMGSMGGYGLFDEAIQVMAEGKFDGEPLVTGKIGVDDIVTGGFEALIKHKEENVKILVSPQ